MLLNCCRPVLFDSLVQLSTLICDYGTFTSLYNVPHTAVPGTCFCLAKEGHQILYRASLIIRVDVSFKTCIVYYACLLAPFPIGMLSIEL